MKQFALITSLIIACSSCDPGVHFERIIENKSSHDIWIKVEQQTNPLFIQDSFKIAKNSSIVVSSSGGLGRVDEFGYCGLNEGTLSSGVFTNDTLEIEKNLSLDDNWQKNVVSKTRIGGGECNCRLVITESDIK